MNFQKEAKELFRTYPTAQEFYFTKDGQAFESYDNAMDHARQLDNKKVEVTPVERSEVNAEPAQEPKQVTAEVVPLSEEQKEVASRKEAVEVLQDKLKKAAAKNKPSIQLQLDTAIAQLAEAEKSLV